MSYDIEKNITRGGLDELVARNASGISSMRGTNLPVMVPIQEKNWDTMVGLLEDTVSFQPKVYSLMKKLLTDEQMADLLNQYLEEEQSICRTMAASLQRQENQVLERMENLAQQAGKNLEKSLNDSLEKGSQLEKAIAQAAKRRSWKAWILIIAVSMLGAMFSALLCIHWLL